MIQVGQVLDKYELLERVGQGGMAVVYRAIDRTLKRVVAVKVLHKHLADYQEARDRFEREAQAVAKLRHENILEIFDYAAQADAEAYIVTEFIDGQTLKQVVTDRPIAFPEIGAMLVLQVGRALAHAHAGGILHRDVKPENIMIRSDGVVKLMDFGISHMVDLERLTVTGQLLGSPAYMAPEHVEGRPLDFRTDVFAAGIVLYQLTVGRLPFEGKNPHEVLKRIAECRFIDPRTANPRIGNRLGRIILRAMAREPADRFAAIGEMVTALEQYLDESGIAPDRIAAELGRYFAAPAAYEQALEDRLIDHLTRRGQTLLDRDDRAAALDLFDRVLTIDPDNEKVLAILDGINRRVRMRAIAMGVMAASVIGGGAFLIHTKSKPDGAEIPPAPTVGSASIQRANHATAHDDEPPPLPVPVDAGVVADVVDAATVAVGPGSNSRSDRTPDAGVPAVAVAGTATKVNVFPVQGTEVSFGDGRWVAVTEDGTLERVLEKPTTIRVRNACCVTEEKQAKPGDVQVAFSLGPKPARLTPRCAVKDATVTVEGKPAEIGQGREVFLSLEAASKNVLVEFVLPDKVVSKKVRVTFDDDLEVTCSEP